MMARILVPHFSLSSCLHHLLLLMVILSGVSLTLSQSPDFKCPEQFGYYPDTVDCSKYFVCVFGDALHESCTGGLYFSVELQTCDWPRNVECANGAKPPLPIEAPPAPPKEKGFTTNRRTLPPTRASRPQSTSRERTSSAGRAGSRYVDDTDDFDSNRNAAVRGVHNQLRTPAIRPTTRVLLQPVTTPSDDEVTAIPFTTQLPVTIIKTEIPQAIGSTDTTSVHLYPETLNNYTNTHHQTETTTPVNDDKQPLDSDEESDEDPPNNRFPGYDPQQPQFDEAVPPVVDSEGRIHIPDGIYSNGPQHPGDLSVFVKPIYDNDDQSTKEDSDGQEEDARRAAVKPDMGGYVSTLYANNGHRDRNADRALTGYRSAQSDEEDSEENSKEKPLPEIVSNNGQHKDPDLVNRFYRTSGSQQPRERSTAVVQLYVPGNNDNPNIYPRIRESPNTYEGYEDPKTDARYPLQQNGEPRYSVQMGGPIGVRYAPAPRPQGEMRYSVQVQEQPVEQSFAHKPSHQQESPYPQSPQYRDQGTIAAYHPSQAAGNNYKVPAATNYRESPPPVSTYRDAPAINAYVNREVTTTRTPAFREQADRTPAFRESTESSTSRELLPNRGPSYRNQPDQLKKQKKEDPVVPIVGGVSVEAGRSITRARDFRPVSPVERPRPVTTNSQEGQMQYVANANREATPQQGSYSYVPKTRVFVTPKVEVTESTNTDTDARKEYSDYARLPYGYPDRYEDDEEEDRRSKQAVFVARQRPVATTRPPPRPRTTTTTTPIPTTTTTTPAPRRRPLPTGVSRPATRAPSLEPRSPPRTPARPPAMYATPTPYSQATKCTTRNCKLPDCKCGGTDNPGGLQSSDIPQVVLLTFDDAVNDLNFDLYEDIFNTRKNPNGCPTLGTFYVSHEWTDYGKVQTLYAQGHEMASHSVTHSYGEKFSKNQWFKEINGQREILHLYGGVKLEDVRGMRAPFLQIGGNKMFEMLHEANFTYDSSMPVFENNPPFWPYTLDYGINHECMITPCPTKSYPGIWEVGMVMWVDLRGGRCSMGDACSNPTDDEGVYKMLIKNFNRHYKSNRAPFGLFYHSAWFSTQHHRKGFMRFIDEINGKDDVWFITNWQLVQWMRNPTPSSKINSFEPWQCNPNPDKPPLCRNPTVCNVWDRSGVRYMKTCQPCPSKYPWVGKTGYEPTG